MSNKLTVDEIIKKYKGLSSFKLTQTEFETLLFALKNETCNINEASRVFICGIEPFTVWIANTYRFLVEKNYTTEEDLLSICREKLLLCIKNFDISKGCSANIFLAYYKKACINALKNYCDNLQKNYYESLDGIIFFHSGRNEEIKLNLHDYLADKPNLDIIDNVILNEIKANIKKLPFNYQRAIKMYFLEGRRMSEIATIEGVTKQAISKRIKKATRQLELMFEQKSDLINENTDAENIFQAKVSNNRKNLLEEFEGQIDYETELLPYLSESYKKVFLEYLLNYNNVSGVKLSKSLNKSPSYSSATIYKIFNKIKNIIQKKQEIDEFYNKIGGKDQIEDIKLFLNETEKIFLEKYILNISPNACVETKKLINLGNIEPGTYKSSRFDKKLETILKRKQNAKDFVKNNGGEEFLLREFGSTLDDEQFFVLKNLMMDYHYISQKDVVNEAGIDERRIGHIKQSILKKIEDYYATKKEVEELIESAGGTEKVFSELFSNLKEDEKVVFLEYTLAYNKPTLQQFADKMGISISRLFDINKKLINKLQQMAMANQKK